MNTLKTVAAIALLVPAIGLAQVSVTTTTLPGAGITPGSILYFLDQLGEALQEALTLNPEAKARLHLEFAGERISEIKVLLEQDEFEISGLDIAKSKLFANVAAAATILEEQTQKGNNMEALAKEINIEFDEKRDLLEEIFEEKERTLETNKDEIKARLTAARRAGNTAEVESLTRQLDDIETQLVLLEQEEEEHEEALEREEERLEKGMEAREEAEEAIREAENEKREIISEAQEKGVSLPAGTFTRFESLISQAKSALVIGNFKEAERLAKQVEESLKTIEETIEELEEAAENEDENDEEKNKNNEAEENENEQNLESEED